MAKRRMFSTDIIDTDSFLDMPSSSKCLYYDLGMRADDDGFVSPKKVVRLTGASEDDLKVLIAKNFIIPFKSGVIVIKDWKMNNYIQKDRYTETIYKEEKKLLVEDDNNSYGLIDEPSIQNVYKLDTQDRLGKDRLGKVSKEKYSSLKDIKDNDIEELAEQYHTSVGFVKLKLETLKNYCESKGKTYKNYKSALRNFVLGDIQREIQRPKKGMVLDATNL